MVVKKKTGAAVEKPAAKKTSKKPAAVKKPAAKKSAVKKTTVPKKSIAAAEAESMTFLTGEGKVKKGGGGAEAILSLKQIQRVKGFNPRVHLGEIDSLAASIKANDLIQAIVVAPSDKPGLYDLVSGDRRRTAVVKLGWSAIKCVIRADLAGRDKDTMLRRKAVAVAENHESGRKNLNMIEQGRVYQEQKDGGWSVARIAKENGGIDQRMVRRYIDLVNAPADVQKQIEDGTLSAKAGLEVAKLDDKTRQAIKSSLTSGVSAPQVKQLAKKAAKVAGAVSTDGKGAQQKKGAERDGALYAWKGNKVKQAMLRELAFYLTAAKGDEVGTSEYHELRGAIAMLLWERGDFESPLMPALDPEGDPEDTNPSASKKLNKEFLKAAAQEAAKYSPPKDEEEAA